MLWTLLSLVLRIKISRVQTPDHNLIGGGQSYRNVAQLSFIDFVLQKEGLVRIACRRRSIGWYCFDSRLVLWSFLKTSRSMSYAKQAAHICHLQPISLHHHCLHQTITKVSPSSTKCSSRPFSECFTIRHILLARIDYCFDVEHLLRFNEIIPPLCEERLLWNG